MTGHYNTRGRELLAQGIDSPESYDVSAPIECNADEGHPCDAGPDESPCPSCLETRAYWERQYRAARRPCTLCLKPTASDDGFCSDECRESCARDFR